MTRAPSPWVKICGITCEEDAEIAILAGADALGLNFVRASKRWIDEDTGQRLVERVAGRVECVAVVADLSLAEAEALRQRVGFGWLQLHGHEAPELTTALPRSFQALGVADATDVERTALWPGERLLLDAKSTTALGGTGQRFDWSLITQLCRARRVILAGGLTPENVADAVRAVQPWGVDVASGVEVNGTPRRKDAAKVQGFVAAARHALLA